MNRPSRRTVSAYLAGALGAAMAGVSINLVTSEGIGSLSGLAAVAGGLGLLLAVAGSFFAARASRDRDDEFASLQRDALGVERLAYECVRLDSASRSLFDVRAALTDRGIWHRDDLEAFDRLIKVRNQVVHGDLDMIDSNELKAAEQEARRLLVLLAAARNRVGHKVNDDLETERGGL